MIHGVESGVDGVVDNVVVDSIGEIFNMSWTGGGG